MPTLILTLDDDLLAQAEAYARRTGTDLSALVAQALRPLVQAPVVLPAEASDFDPLIQIQELLGYVSLPADYDYKEERVRDFLTRGK